MEKFLETYAKSWNLEEILVLLGGNDHGLEPLGKHPDTHLTPSRARLEQNEPGEQETDDESIPRIDGSSSDLNPVRSTEGDAHSEERSEQTRFEPSSGRLVGANSWVLLELSPPQNGEDGVHWQVN